MPIRAFQQSITPAIKSDISDWLYKNNTYTNQQNIYKHLRWVSLKIFKENRYTTELMVYANQSIPVSKISDKVAIDHITNMFLSAMLKWASDDSKLPITFRINCYNARLKIFLRQLHAGVDGINHLDGLG